MHCGNAKVNVSREQIVIEGVMSPIGTKRTIAALQQFVGYWGNSGPAERVLRT
jgi:hypothetical protein